MRPVLALLALACHRPADAPPPTSAPTSTPTPTSSNPTPPTSPPPDGAPRRPFPHGLAFGVDVVRPSIGQDALDDLVTDAYDAWAERYLVDAGPDQARVRMAERAGAETTSEAQGYGMVLVAWLAGHDPDAKVRFDALWRYAAAHPSALDGGLMDWHVPSDGAAEPGDDDSAFDGDADIAFALLLADAQWGSDGDVDYAAEARARIDAEADRALGPASSWPLLGDWVEPDGARYNQWTPRSSDWMPDRFRAFAAATGDPRWEAAVDAAYDAVVQIQADHAPATGLVPDFLVRDGDAGRALRPAPPGFLEADTDGAYSYNACRFPWRFGVDAAHAGDPRGIEVVGRLTDWARATTDDAPTRFAAGYALDGDVLPGARYQTAAFLAPLAVGALTAGPDAQAWLDDAVDAVATTHEGYYEDTLALLSLLAVSGRDWAP